MTGYSKITKLGTGKIYAGGTTIAEHDVESIQVGVIVERAKEEDSSWTTYTGWKKENSNTDRVSSNRTLYVDGGYYYRVRCTHVANSDMSSSFTDGIYIESPTLTSIREHYHRKKKNKKNYEQKKEITFLR